MARKMKDGKFGEQSAAQQGLLSDPKCFICGRKMKQGSKAIATYSSIGFLGKRNDRKQFCTWKCAEAHHGK